MPKNLIFRHDSLSSSPVNTCYRLKKKREKHFNPEKVLIVPQRQNSIFCFMIYLTFYPQLLKRFFFVFFQTIHLTRFASSLSSATAYTKLSLDPFFPLIKLRAQKLDTPHNYTNLIYIIISFIVFIVLLLFNNQFYLI